jgi:hypothetical protein
MITTYGVFFWRDADDLHSGFGLEFVRALLLLYEPAVHLEEDAE